MQTHKLSSTFSKSEFFGSAVTCQAKSYATCTSHGVPCKYQAPLLSNQYVSQLPCRRRRILILQAVVNASGVRSTTPNSSLYVTVAVLGNKLCKTTTSSGPTPTWDTSCELLVVSLCRLFGCRFLSLLVLLEWLNHPPSSPFVSNVPVEGWYLSA